MRRIILPLLVVSVAATGCASKKYVSHEVGEVNQKVDNLSGEVEKTQQRVKDTEVRLDSVDRDSKTGISEAKGSATAAMNKAVEAERAAMAELEGGCRIPLGAVCLTTEGGLTLFVKMLEPDGSGVRTSRVIVDPCDPAASGVAAARGLR